MYQVLNNLQQYKKLSIPVIGSVILYLFFAYWLERSDFLNLLLLYTGLFYCAWRLIKATKINFWVLAGMGIFFRFLFLPAIPNLSQDFYRFLWDGQLMLQGFNPYLSTPQGIIDELSTTLEVTYRIQMAHASELVRGMGSLNASHYSNYPPINQLFFLLGGLFAKHSVLAGVIGLRVCIIAADIGILYFGKKLLQHLKLPVKNIFWYFLNPFIIIELTGNLHFEGVMLFFVIWAFYVLHKGKWFWAAVLLGISISVKLLPLLFLPLFFKWFFKKEVSVMRNVTSSFPFYITLLITVLLTFAPFLSQDFITNFSATIGLWFQKFEFNASVYYIIRWIGFQVVGWNVIATAGKILPIIVILFILGVAFFRPLDKTRSDQKTQQLITSILFCVSFYFLLSTTVHPWYVATPLILSLFTRYKFPIVWSFMVIFSYSAYGSEGFQENLGLVAIEYLVVIGIAIYEISFKKNTPIVERENNSENLTSKTI